MSGTKGETRSSTSREEAQKQPRERECYGIMGSEAEEWMNDGSECCG